MPQQADSTAFIAVSSLSPDASGAITWWRLSGDTDLPTLTAAWTKAGLPPSYLPKGASTEVALRRALEVAITDSKFIRPISSKDERGFVVVHETYDHETGRPQYHHGVEVVFTKEKEQRGTYKVLHADGPMELAIRDEHIRQQNRLTQQDVSSWLVRLVDKVMAVALRDTGGIYFVPRGKATIWNSFVSVIRATTPNAIYEIQALKTTEALDAVVAAITREADEAVKRIDQELEASNLGERALETRKETCAALSEKLRSYEEQLGLRLDDVRARVGDADARVAVAILQSINANTPATEEGASSSGALK